MFLLHLLPASLVDYQEARGLGPLNRTIKPFQKTVAAAMLYYISISEFFCKIYCGEFDLIARSTVHTKFRKIEYLTFIYFFIQIFL